MRIVIASSICQLVVLILCGFAFTGVFCDIFGIQVSDRLSAPIIEGIGVGSRVSRGPSWKYDDQDGGEGAEGSVIELRRWRSLVANITNVTGVRVLWDSGNINTYRWAPHAGVEDLKVVGWATLPPSAMDLPSYSETLLDSISKMKSSEKTVALLLELSDAFSGYQWKSRQRWPITSRFMDSSSYGVFNEGLLAAVEQNPCTYNWEGIACRDGHVIGIDLSGNNLHLIVSEEFGSIVDSKRSHKFLISTPSPLTSTSQPQTHMGSEDFGRAYFKKMMKPHFAAESKNKGDPYRGKNLFAQVLLEKSLHNSEEQRAKPLSSLETIFKSAVDEKSSASLISTFHDSASDEVGKLPTALIELLPQLESLSLSRNNLNLILDESICLGKRLRFLDLSHTKLRGSLPPCLANLIHLETLDLSNNFLSGKIPEEWSRFKSSSMEFIFLHGNYDIASSEEDIPIALRDSVNIRVSSSISSKKGLVISLSN